MVGALGAVPETGKFAAVRISHIRYDGNLPVVIREETWALGKTRLMQHWTRHVEFFDSGFSPPKKSVKYAPYQKHRIMGHDSYLPYEQEIERRERKYQGSRKPNYIDSDTWRDNFGLADPDLCSLALPRPAPMTEGVGKGPDGGKGKQGQRQGNRSRTREGARAKPELDSGTDTLINAWFIDFVHFALPCRPDADACIKIHFRLNSPTYLGFTYLMHCTAHRILNTHIESNIFACHM